MDNSEPEDAATLLAKQFARLSPEKRALLLQRRAASNQSGFEAVAQALHEYGITHVYAVSGEPMGRILPACAQLNIRPIGVHHQSAAVCMAVAHNYQAGRLVAAALVSAGPAATNAITGLLVANENGWPVVVLGGRRTSFQKLDVLPIVSHATKHAVTIVPADSIGERIQAACRTAMSDRPGAVFVELHEDALNARVMRIEGRHTASKCTGQSPPLASQAEIGKVADGLLNAKRPALLLGKGTRWSVAPSRLRELLELLYLPFITSPMGRGFIPEDHPLCCNSARTALQSQADTILVLGARLNWMFRHGAGLSRDATVFRVDVHADEGEATIPTELIHADAGDFVTRLLQELDSRRTEISHELRQQDLSRWYDTLTTVANNTRQLLEQRLQDDNCPMSPYRMMKEIRDALPRNAICVTEGNVSMRIAQAVIPAYSPASRMDAGSNACMGVGIPFAIGAKVARPDRPVVAVVGDFGFSQSAMELEVCVRHGIPVVAVVANNQGNVGALRQMEYFPRPDAELVTMFQPGIEYDHLMKMFGGRGETITDPNRIRPALEHAIAANQPYCLNVVIDPETPLPNAWGEEASQRS